MRPILRSASLIAGLLALGACASTTPEDTSDSSQEVSTSSVLDGSETSFTIERSGSGVLMPAGSECAPGYELLAVELAPATRVFRGTCAPNVDGTYGLRSQITTDAAAAQTILAATKRVRPSTATTCDRSKQDVLLSLAGPNAAQPSFYEDHYACEPRTFLPGPHVTGLDAVLAAARDVLSSIAPVAEAPRPYLDGLPADEGGAWSFQIENVGAGDIPMGSSCAPGSEKYFFSPSHLLFYWHTCEATAPNNPRLQTRFHFRQLREGDADGLLHAISQGRTTSTPRCEAGQPRMLLRRSKLGKQAETMISEATACHGTSGQPITNIEPIFTAARALATNALVVSP